MVSTLGITGGIGSGKSLACQFLSDLGAYVFEADKVARRLMEQSAGIREAIQLAFGPESYLSDGQLNRAWLAARVFSDTSELAQLNAIVHPGVRLEFERVKSTCDSLLMVHEAALIYEAGLDRQLDAVAVIVAPVDVRIRRVQLRDGVAEHEVRKRMAHQLPQKELERRADVVVVNTAGPETLRRKMTRLFRLSTSAQPLTRDAFRNCRRL